MTNNNELEQGISVSNVNTVCWKRERCILLLFFIIFICRTAKKTILAFSLQGVSSIRYSSFHFTALVFATLSRIEWFFFFYTYISKQAVRVVIKRLNQELFHERTALWINLINVCFNSVEKIIHYKDSPSLPVVWSFIKVKSSIKMNI